MYHILPWKKFALQGHRWGLHKAGARKSKSQPKLENSHFTIEILQFCVHNVYDFAFCRLINTGMMRNFWGLGPIKGLLYHKFSLRIGRVQHERHQISTGADASVEAALTRSLHCVQYP